MAKKHFIKEIIFDQELFVHFFNSMNDMVILVQVINNKINRTVFANDAANSFINSHVITNGSFLYEAFLSRLIPNLDEIAKQAIIKENPIVTEQILMIPLEITSCHKPEQTGKIPVYMKATLSPFNNKQDCTDYILIYISDITEQKKQESERINAIRRFELVWNSTADAMFTFNEHGNYVNVNKAFEELFGWNEEELLQDELISIIPNKERDELDWVIDELKRGQVVPSHNVQRVGKDGEVYDVLATYSPIFDQNGNWEGGVAVYKDITDQMKYLKGLKESEEKFRLIAENTSDLIKITDAKGTVIYTSPSHFPILGIDPNTVAHHSILENIYPDDIEHFRNHLKKIVESKVSVSLEFRRSNKGGHIVWFHSIGTPILNSNQNVEQIVFVARDITERKKQEEKLKKLALFDFLTDLPNRSYFYKKMKAEIKKSKKKQKIFAIMMLDLDYFKQINDTMGHDIGDQVLKGFSYRVNQCLQEKDIFARLGGDEFVILLPEIKDKIEAVHVAESILNSMKLEWNIGDFTFTTTSSIGITYFQSDNQNHRILLKEADIALYRAKETGRNTFHVFDMPL